MGGPESRCQAVGVDLKVVGQSFEVDQSVGASSREVRRVGEDLSPKWHLPS